MLCMCFGNVGRARVVFDCGRGRLLALTKENDLSRAPDKCGLKAVVSPPFEAALSLDVYIERVRERPNVGIVRRFNG